MGVSQQIILKACLIQYRKALDQDRSKNGKALKFSDFFTVFENITKIEGIALADLMIHSKCKLIRISIAQQIV